MLLCFVLSLSTYCVCIGLCMYNNNNVCIINFKAIMVRVGNGRHVHPLLSVSICVISLVDCW